MTESSTYCLNFVICNTKKIEYLHAIFTYKVITKSFGKFSIVTLGESGMPRLWWVHSQMFQFP
jgi:hypothetical protein